MYELHRIFCASAWELESERQAFHQAIGDCNEAEGMPRGILYVPVSLVNIGNKRPLQYAVDDNIRQCRYFVAALSEGWGPPERDFERDYRLAMECRDDPALPMRDVALLAKRGTAIPPGFPETTAEFSTRLEFQAEVRALLSRWLSEVSP